MLQLAIYALFALVIPLDAFSTPYIDYDNDFVDPSYILAKDFDPSTNGAQTSIIQWADFLSAQGPWCE